MCGPSSLQLFNHEIVDNGNLNPFKANLLCLSIELH